MLNFKSKNLNHYVEAGKLIDENSRKFIRNSLGVNKKKVEAARHAILSGPPGVGKTYGTMDECKKNKVNYILVEEGITDINLATKLSVGVYNLKKNQELIVILDDADSVVFGDYQTLNKWKIATAEGDAELGILPVFNHAKNLTNHFNTLQKQGRFELVKAMKAFVPDDGLGVSIPMDRVRFLVLCNKNLEDPKAFTGAGAAKMRAGVAPVLDRMNYKRVEADKNGQWGWAAYVLGQTQPFPGYNLTNAQKTELMTWMYSNWDNLRSTSYRMVRKLAEAMINEPDNYYGSWEEKLRGH